MTENTKEPNPISVQVTDHPDGRVSVTCDSVTWSALGMIILAWYDPSDDATTGVANAMAASSELSERVEAFLDQMEHMATTRNTTRRAQ